MLDEPSPQKKIEKTPKIQKEKEDAFPTKSVENLAKIEEDRLVIIDQQLSAGQMKIISQNFQDDNDLLFKEIVLSNNGISEDEFSNLMEALNPEQVDMVQSIIYSKNAMDMRSLDIMASRFLSKKGESTLKKLVLIQA